MLRGLVPIVLVVIVILRGYGVGVVGRLVSFIAVVCALVQVEQMGVNERIFAGDIEQGEFIAMAGYVSERLYIALLVYEVIRPFLEDVSH